MSFQNRSPCRFLNPQSSSKNFMCFENRRGSTTLKQATQCLVLVWSTIVRGIQWVSLGQTAKKTFPLSKRLYSHWVCCHKKKTCPSRWEWLAWSRHGTSLSTCSRSRCLPKERLFKIILILRMDWLIPMTKYFKNGSVKIHFCTSRGQSEKKHDSQMVWMASANKLSILWFSDGTGANGGEHCGVQAKWDDQVLCFYHRSYKPGDMIHGLNKQQYGLVY